MTEYIAVICLIPNILYCFFSMSISSLRPCQIIPLEKIYAQSNKIIKLFLFFYPFCYNTDPFGMKIIHRQQIFQL